MKNETLFFHGESVDKRRSTIAALYVAEASDFLLGIAICGKNDQFVKKIGRDKAEGRLRSEGFKGCSIAALYSTKFFEESWKSLLGFVRNYKNLLLKNSKANLIWIINGLFLLDGY